MKMMGAVYGPGLGYVPLYLFTTYKLDNGYPPSTFRWQIILYEIEVQWLEKKGSCPSALNFLNWDGHVSMTGNNIYLNIELLIFILTVV